MPDRRAGRSMKPFTCGLFYFFQIFTQETRAPSRSVKRSVTMSSASELSAPASASFGLFCSPPATALEEPTHRESIKDRNRIDQRRRREVVLSSQRARRAQVLAQSRGVWDGVPAPEAFDLSVEDHGESEAESESMEAVATPASATAAADEMDTGAGGSGGKRAGRSGRTRRGPGRNVAAEQLTSAEWLVDVPPDLAGSWYVTPRPAGWRPEPEIGEKQPFLRRPWRVTCGPGPTVGVRSQKLASRNYFWSFLQRQWRAACGPGPIARNFATPCADA